MKKLSTNHGITIEKEIELAMSHPGTTPFYYYFIQAVLLIFLCSSVLFCFVSGMKVEVEKLPLAAGIFIFVLWYGGIFLLQRDTKHVVLLSMILYVIAGYLFWDKIQEGYVHVANAVIVLYNEYFQAGVVELAVGSLYAEREIIWFLLYVMFPVSGVICFTILYGRTVIGYLIVTIPIVFFSFIVGYTPEPIWYLGYVSGSIALFASVISEKYGLFLGGVGHRRTAKRFSFAMLDKKRILIQLCCLGTILAISLVSYLVYSPEWYEREVDVTEIKQDLQLKMEQFTSGELLKNTLFGELFGQGARHANSGLSNGRLGRVDRLQYSNETALTITTQSSVENSPCYVKGYVGEVYGKNQWRELSDSDQNRLKELESVILNGNSVEGLPSSLFKILRESPYNYYTYYVKTMKIENVSADNSVNYIPYFLSDEFTVEDGKIHSNTGNMVYYMFGLDQYEADTTALNRVYKNVKINTLLQMNVVNRAIIQNWLGTTLSENWYSQLDGAQAEEVNVPVSAVSSVASIPVAQVSDDWQANTPSMFQLVRLLEDIPFSNLIDTVYELGQYEAQENAYFNYVKEVYTKLPEGQLDQVKELVKEYQVQVEVEDTKGSPYETIDSIDGTEEFYRIYERLMEGTLDGMELLENDFEQSDSEYIQEQYYKAISFVQNYLEQNMSYTLSPGKTPSGQDFVEYFLFENKKGYCMHYASAATVMLRAMGVPARYVEGYVITTSDFENGKTTMYSDIKKYGVGSNGDYMACNVLTLDIKDTNAHAWVEVYLPGLGWVPIEVTGPYSVGSDIEIPPVNANPNATLKPTAKPSQSVRPSQSAKPSSSTKPSTSPTINPNKSSNSAFGGIKGNGVFRGLLDWYEGLPTIIRHLINLILLFIVGSLGAILIIEIRRWVIITMRNRQISEKTFNEKVLYEYRILEKIYGKQIAYHSDLSTKEFAAQMVACYPFMSEQEVRLYYTILLKAKFYHQRLTQKEVAYIDLFHQKFIHGLYEVASPWKRWYYKNICII